MHPDSNNEEIWDPNQNKMTFSEKFGGLISLVKDNLNFSKRTDINFFTRVKESLEEKKLRDFFQLLAKRVAKIHLGISKKEATEFSQLFNLKRIRFINFIERKLFSEEELMKQINKLKLMQYLQQKSFFKSEKETKLGVDELMEEMERMEHFRKICEKNIVREYNFRNGTRKLFFFLLQNTQFIFMVKK